MKIHIYKSFLKTCLDEAIANPDVVLMTQLTVSNVNVSDDDVHVYAKEYWADEDVRRMYKKLSELLQMRMQEKVNEGKWDRLMALEYLKCFYDWRKEDDKEKVVKVVMEKVRVDGVEVDLYVPRSS